MPTLAVLLGGVLLQSMNVLMLTTVLPSIVGELGGVAMLSWPTTAFSRHPLSPRAVPACSRLWSVPGRRIASA
jgi:hypothetical protein